MSASLWLQLSRYPCDSLSINRIVVGASLDQCYCVSAMSIGKRRETSDLWPVCMNVPLSKSVNEARRVVFTQKGMSIDGLTRAA